MSHAHSFFTLLLLLLAFSTEGALYGHGLSRCQFNSYDGHDAVYLEQYYFNKELGFQYNSTLGKMVGYTEKAKKDADLYNNDPRFIHLEMWRTERCRKSVPVVYNGFVNPVEPYVRLRSVDSASSTHPGVLICSVYDFYPKQIRVTWLRDGKMVTSEVTSTDELSNGNWLYQIHSHLEYTPRPGEKITCMVEHASLKEPKLYDWEPVSDPSTNKIAVGAAGLLLGLVFLVAGLIFYKKKSSERVLVPTTEVLYPENAL